MKKLTALLISMILVLSGCTSTAQSTASTSTSEGMTITVFKAGKADAILFKTSEGYILMDTGLDKNKDDLVSQLQDFGVTEIKALIITHFDKDHVGGADAIVNSFNVDSVYTTYMTEDSTDVSEFEEALQNKQLNMTIIKNTTETLTIGSAVFSINGASGSYSEKKDNNSSLITMVTYGSQKYLFMGDAENERIEEYLNANDASADFLKVPYHGYYQDSLSKLVQAVSPSSAVITNSKSEPAADELNETKSLLQNAGANVYCTYDGNITITCTEDSFTISQ